MKNYYYCYHKRLVLLIFTDLKRAKLNLFKSILNNKLINQLKNLNYLKHQAVTELDDLVLLNIHFLNSKKLGAILLKIRAATSITKINNQHL